MNFKEILTQIVEWLEQEQRVSYRAIKRQFELDDAYLDDLKESILYAYPVEDDGRGLIWKGYDDQGDQQAYTQDSSIPTHISAERRQITVMFCDLAGSTALSQQLDPEDLREVIRTYQTTAAKAIAHFDGYIAQYLGDGLLVYFGWPRAHEDDPRRAVHSGLEIIERLQSELNPQLIARKGVSLALRIGIHTGPVVVGQMGGAQRHENLALGETVNIAARLEGLAEPNTVIVSSSTERLLHRNFDMADLGLQALKGVAEPFQVYQVLGQRDRHQADENAGRQALPFLVGRDEEIGLLFRRWNQSKEGLGQAVFIGGAAGIGKSVLADTIRAHVRNENHSYLTFHCASYHQNSAFYPVIARLEKRLGFDSDDSDTDKRAKLEQCYQNFKQPPGGVLEPIASLLSIAVDDNQREQEGISQNRKQDILDAVVTWLAIEAEESPLLIIWEDLHWTDPSSLELVELLLAQIPTMPVLCILTYRPEFEIPWPRRSHITSLTLNRLERSQTSAMISHLARNKSLPDEVIEHILTKTDGVPLFVEELTKMLLDSNLLSEEEGQFVLTGSLSTLSIPDTLQDSLMARLDQLNTAKEIAQLGAVIGREFRYQLLRAISEQDEELLHAGLEQLVEAEMLYCRGRIPRSTYIFKHALIQDAAYASLLKSKRQKIHLHIAQSLETQFADIRQNQPELIAKHFTEADNNEKACKYWLEAGKYAGQHSAHAEAIAHFTTGLKILEKLPESEDRKLKELNLRVGLVPSLLAMKGYASKEAGELLTRARELCRETGDTSQLLSILWGLSSYFLVGADHFSAREIGEELVMIAEDSNDPVHHIHAGLSASIAEYCLANFTLSTDYLRRRISHYKPEQHQVYVAQYGIDLGIFLKSFGAQPVWFVGHPDEAMEMSNEAMSLAHELGHPFSLSMACGYAAMFHQIRRDVKSTYATAQEAVEVSDEHQFVYYGAWGRIFRGWASAMAGDLTASAEDIRTGIRTLDDTGTRRSKPYFLGILAEVLSIKGSVEEALELLTEALRIADQISEPWWISELHRLKGEMYLQRPESHSKAEQCFERALQVARAQSARLLELRATVSMATLWQQQGKEDLAHALLQKIYGGFGEGYETPDFLQAKKLLKALEPV